MAGSGAIEDRQTAVAESQAGCGVVPQACIIGAAMADGAGHGIRPAQEFRASSRRIGMPDADKTAHS
jgi:hypothetical protein